jgi:plasmid stabilization system protein ParE
MVYQIVWTQRAFSELDDLLAYLVLNTSESVVSQFMRKLQKKITIIETSPSIYALVSKKRRVRRCLISKNQALYYKIQQKQVVLLTLFDTRQNPLKLNI